MKQLFIFIVLATSFLKFNEAKLGFNWDIYETSLRNSDYKVVCYFTNWAWYRPGIGKYLPDHINADLCTHISYGFATLDSVDLTMKPFDTWADLDNKFYEKITSLRTRGVKVVIALGGWNDSEGDKYSRLVNNPSRRANFIQHALEFIQKYNFDGLDLDWEYPKCWQGDCNRGPGSDKSAFAAFVRELHDAFQPRGYLLSAAVSPSKTVIDVAYDVPTLSKYLDWIGVMNYDYHGQWDGKTGHVSPLYYYPGDTYDYFNTNFTIHYYMQNGADRSKLILGMPFYGQSFTLQNSNQNGLNAPTNGGGQPGEFTRASGLLSFYEICSQVKSAHWTVVRDNQGRMGPYATLNNQWVGYDDIDDIKRKSQYLQTLNLGGAMFWALDLDDFNGVCGCGRYPLLRRLNYELRGIPLEFNQNNCT